MKACFIKEPVVLAGIFSDVNNWGKIIMEDENCDHNSDRILDDKKLNEVLKICSHPGVLSIKSTDDMVLLDQKIEEKPIVVKKTILSSKSFYEKNNKNFKVEKTDMNK